MSEGKTRKYSVSLPQELAETIRSKTGPGGFSGYVTAAVARQLERDNLNEIIAAAEAEHGPADATAVETKRALLTDEDAHQTGQTGAA